MSSLRFVTLACCALIALAVPAPAQGSPSVMAGGREADEKSTLLAIGLSGGAMAVGVGTIVVAGMRSGPVTAVQNLAYAGGVALALLGPSAGHVYTGHHGRAALFSAGRVALAALAFYGLEDTLSHDDRGDPHKARNERFMVGGLLGTGALALGELVDVYLCARRTQRSSVELAVVPLLASAGGMAIAGRF